MEVLAFGRVIETTSAHERSNCVFPLSSFLSLLFHAILHVFLKPANILNVFTLLKKILHTQLRAQIPGNHFQQHELIN